MSQKFRLVCSLGQHLGRCHLTPFEIALRLSVSPGACVQGLREDLTMICRRIAIFAIGLCLGLSALFFGSAESQAGTVKIGVLKFGTVGWELDVIKQHGLDKAAGIDLSIVELANNQATVVALQAGEVDVIVTDWLWVTRQRAEGTRFTFVPYSTSVGSLVVPGD